MDFDYAQLIRSLNAVSMTGLKNGVLMGKRDGLMLAAKICDEQYRKGCDAGALSIATGAAVCATAIRAEIRKLNADAQEVQMPDTHQTGRSEPKGGQVPAGNERPSPLEATEDLPASSAPDSPHELPWLQRTCEHEWEDGICVHCQLHQDPTGPLPTMWEDTIDERLDDPRRGQAREINK